MTRMIHLKGGSITEQDALDAYRELYWKKNDYQLSLTDWADVSFVRSVIRTIEQQMELIVRLLGYTPGV